MAHDLTRNPLEPSLNPPHDTRLDTRLLILTEVDGSMNPLEELDDTTKGLENSGVKPVCCEIVRYPLHTSRAYIYTLVLTLLLVDYEYNIKCLN
jgi:hypothetical protein